MAYYILKSYKLKFAPFEIFRVLKDYHRCFFLDSSLKTRDSGRYSFLGINPFSQLELKAEAPFKGIAKILNSYKLASPKGSPPFLGGAVGYLTYDLGLLLEKKLRPADKPELGIPDCLFYFYNTVLIIDHLKQLLFICSTGFPERSYSLGKSLAESNFKEISKIISKACSQKKSPKNSIRPAKEEGLKSNFSKEGYIAAIKRAKEYIRSGDIYQVNLSQRFQAKTALSGFQIYQRMRRINPSCFGAYLDAGDHQILSSSPERFLKVEGNKVITRPMKGTRPRSKNRKIDAFLKKELLMSPKDKAELVMIVDLERNDLGRACSYDSIRVTNLRQLEKYNTVYQTTATIEGLLYKDKSRLDLLRACFPGGSITGCPKIRSMEIIEELEPDRRSIYTGVLGYLSFSGNMDFNILIRTILKINKTLYFGAGGGIVADSEPEAEYRETLVKAAAIKEAINAA